MSGEYPDCPTCESDIWVDGYTGHEAFICHSCGRVFNPPLAYRK